MKHALNMRTLGLFYRVTLKLHRETHLYKDTTWNSASAANKQLHGEKSNIHDLHSREDCLMLVKVTSTYFSYQERIFTNSL